MERGHPAVTKFDDSMISFPEMRSLDDSSISRYPRFIFLQNGPFQLFPNILTALYYGGIQYTVVNCVCRMENAAANQYGMSRVQITFDFAADHTWDSLTTSIFDLIHQCWSSDRLAWSWWQMRPCSTVWFRPACVPKQIYGISRNLPVLFISFLIKYCLCVFGC